MVLLAFALLAIAGQDLAYPMADYFHEGEYLGLVPHMLRYYDGTVPFPLLVHGAMDYLPGLLSYKWHGYARVIIDTRAFNALISCVSLFLFLLLADTIAKRADRPRGYRITVAAVIALILMPLSSDAFAPHQRPLNPRDLFILLQLFLFVKAEFEGPPATRLAVAALIGLASAVAPFWAYDRGLIAVVSFALMCLGLVVAAKKHEAIAAATGFGLTLVVLNVTRVFGTVGENLSNIAYWVENGGMWTYPWTANTIVIALLFMCLTAAVTLLVARLSVVNWRSGRPLFSVFLGVLIIIQLLFAKSFLNRADAVHLYSALWPTVLGLIAIFTDRYHLTAAAPDPRNRLRKLRTGYLVGGVLLFGLSLLRMQRQWGAESLFRTLGDRGSDRRVVADANLVSAVEFYTATSPGCVLEWSNTGIVALLARLPYCAGVAYSVYVARAEEGEYLRRLVSNPPKSLVYNPEFWAYRIDGQTMPQRLPRIDAFIRNNYRLTAEFGDWKVLELFSQQVAPH